MFYNTVFIPIYSLLSYTILHVGVETMVSGRVSRGFVR
jgi:hypothetical protein